MKIHLAFLGALALTTAASATEPSSDRRAVSLWYDAFSRGDPSMLDQALARDWVDLPSTPGEPAGPGAAKAFLVRFRAAFPDLTIHVDDIIQDGDKMVVRSRIRGTLREPFLGASANGQKLDIQAIDIHQVRDGQIVRTWHSEDWMTGLRQLGVISR